MYVCMYGHRSSAANFNSSFQRKILLQFEVNDSRRSIMKSCMQCWTESALLEACKFVKTFISFINVAIYLA